MNDEVTIVKNPFGTLPKENNTAMVEIESQRSIQEVQAALVIAKKFPRNEIEAMDKILRSCTRKSLAESAMYSYPRGGTEVTGPSIRLAETLAQNWGNIKYGIKELSQENGSSTIEAFAWDTETNTYSSKVFQVKHERKAKNQTHKLTDSRDIYELVANNGARRLRACILAVIPGDIVEAAMNQCAVTQHTNETITPESIKTLITSFEEFGVDEEMLKKRIGKRLEAINPAQVIQLRKIYTSLKDGMSKKEDWFEITNISPDMTDAFKGEKSAPEKPSKAKSKIVDGVDQETGEVVGDNSAV